VYSFVTHIRLISSIHVLKLSNIGELNLVQKGQSKLNVVEIEVLILAFIILASGVGFLIINFGLLGK
jgi:hypothetical protein